MYPPSKTPRDQPYLHTPSWGDVIATYAMFAAIPLALWAMYHPLTTIVVTGLSIGLWVAYRRGRGFLRVALRERTVTVQVGQSLQIRVTRPRDTKQTTSETCCP